MYDYVEESIHVSQLRNWDHPFKDTKNFVLDDVPEEYEGSK